MDERPIAPWTDLERGTKLSRAVPICQLAGGQQLALNVLIAKGRSDGPTLLLLSGVHGDEYEGPLALWHVSDELDPEKLSGVVVCLPVTNPPAYESGLRVNPADPKDLARTFPGSPTGSVTEQIAYYVQSGLIAGADFLLDLHSAGRYYRIDPWAGYGLSPNAATLHRQRRAATVLGYPTVWGTPMKPGRTLSAAQDLNVPALYVEAPGEGRARPEDVERNVRAVRQLMRFLEMVDEPVEPYTPERVVEDDAPDAGHLQIQIVSRHGGFFVPDVTIGGEANRGHRFGRILDPAGKTVEVIAVPDTGRVVFLRTFPIVAPGDSLGTVLTPP